MDLTKKTIKAGSWQFTSVATRVCLQLLVLAVLARYVSPKEFGYIAMANMVMVFIDMFADAGIGPAIIQKKELTENHINAGFFLSVILGILFVSILWLGAPIIADFFRADDLVSIIRWIGFSALITKLSSVSRARIERDMRFDILMWVDSGSYLVGFASVGIVLAVLGYGVWAIVAGKLAQCSLQTICLLTIRPNLTKLVFSRNEYKELLTYGGGLTISRIFDNIASQGDYFVIGRLLGSTSLGFYDRASSLMVMPGQYLNLVLDKTLFPAMSQIQSQKKRLEKAYFSSTSIVSTLLIPLTVLMYLIAPEIITTLLGPNWSASILPFRVLLITVIFRIFMNVSDTLVRATGAVYASAARKAVLAFMILFGSWIGQFWGLSGVAIAVDIAILIGYVLMLQLCIKIINFRLIDYLKLYINGSIIGFILCLMILPLVTILRLYTESKLIVLCATFFCSIFLIMFLFKFYPRMFGESLVGFKNQVLLMVRLKKPLPFNFTKTEKY